MQNPQSNSKPSFALIAAAWTVVLLISDLPDVVFSSLVDVPLPEWLFWVKVGLLAIFLALCLLWERMRALWQFALVMLVFYLAIGLTARLRSMDWWQSRFNIEGVSFTTGFAGIFLLDFLITLAVIVTLWLIKRKRGDFFLVKGELDAPIEPVRWLGIKEGESWRTFAWIFAIVAMLLVAIPTIIGIGPDAGMFMRALPLLPAAVLFAAINAFNEEVYYRLSMLATLPQAVGRGHALALSVAIFGMAHYLYGSPPGVLGFAMTGFLAYLMGKAILETRGLLWAWLIHFLPDVAIFLSYTLLWVQA